MTAGRSSIEVAAIVFAESNRGGSFAVKQFGEFLSMAGEREEEERLDEILSDLVAGGSLREIGPGVYAQAASTCDVPLQQPLWPEEAGR